MLRLLEQLTEDDAGANREQSGGDEDRVGATAKRWIERRRDESLDGLSSRIRDAPSPEGTDGVDGDGQHRRRGPVDNLRIVVPQQLRERRHAGCYITPGHDQIDQIRYCPRIVVIEEWTGGWPQIGDGRGKRVGIRRGEVVEERDDRNEGVRMRVGGKGDAKAAAFLRPGPLECLEEYGPAGGDRLSCEQFESLIKRRHGGQLRAEVLRPGGHAKGDPAAAQLTAGPTHRPNYWSVIGLRTLHAVVSVFLELSGCLCDQRGNNASH